ncbi:MAG: Binding-protein-dependent transport systems inner membrane component [Thermotoga petrophila]|jgi:multiple sugar transport system permease protein|uniref:Binding-protein-dependent transport systems inner membrane component n=1 Tax=Thermotoga petrophila TaxID=93929 RepID=A0A101EQN8_9THEM|nr:MAG: Binding-protein-dependent transport systems inner membrane component [Thermotoga petrophila]
MRANIFWILVLAGPSLALLLIFSIIPIFFSLTLSFTDFNIFALIDWSRARFVGLENFRTLFQDELFWRALFNTFYCLIIAMPVTTILALLNAILMNRKDLKFKTLFRIFFFLPFVTNTVAIAVVWAWIFNPNYGILNWFLGLLGIKGPNWLGDPRWAMPAIIILVVWKGLGYNTLLFLAGLQNIPEQLYEAARLDGANAWQRFWYVTLPMLRPTTVFVTTMMIIGYLQLFEEPYMLTQGGPVNSTLSVVLYLYRQGFKFYKFGYASAIAVVLFLIIIALTLIRLKIAKHVEEGGAV